MKTTLKSILTLSLLLVFAIYGYSQNAATAPAKETKTTSTTTCGKFTDNNKDGICDNHQNKENCKGNSSCCGKGMQHCKETCQGKGNCKGEAKGCGQACSQGKGKGNCNGHGHGNGCAGKTTEPSK